MEEKQRKLIKLKDLINEAENIKEIGTNFLNAIPINIIANESDEFYGEFKDYEFGGLNEKLQEMQSKFIGMYEIWFSTVFDLVKKHYSHKSEDFHQSYKEILDIINLQVHPFGGKREILLKSFNSYLISQIQILDIMRKIIEQEENFQIEENEMEIPELAEKVLEKIFQYYSNNLKEPLNKGRLLNLVPKIDAVLRNKIVAVLKYLDDLKYITFKEMGSMEGNELWDIRITAQGINHIRDKNAEPESKRKSEKVKLDQSESKFQKFLDVQNVQDDFYIQLIKEINLLYNNKIPISLWIMIRKLFENLLIDILRKQYGFKELENRNLFYWEEKGRYHDFNILLENFKGRINDFKPIIPELNSNLIQPLDRFRERAGSAAHNLTMKSSMQEIDDIQNELNYLVKLFFRIHKELTD